MHMTILSQGPVPKGAKSLADVGNVRRVAVATDRSETADLAGEWAAAPPVGIVSALPSSHDRPHHGEARPARAVRLERTGSADARPSSAQRARRARADVQQARPDPVDAA